MPVVEKVYYKRRPAAAKAARVYRPRKVAAQAARVPRPRVSAAQSVQAGGPGVMSSVGGALGSVFGKGGKTIGAGLGSLADKAISWLSGKGDYKVSGNSLLMGEQPAMFKHSQHGKGYRIQHREFIQDVISSTGTNITPLTVSPTNPLVFPWLSGIASQFEQYFVRGAIFQYVNESGAVSTNQALGYVLLGTEYDSNKPAPIQKSSLANYDYSTMCVPCENMMHPLECDPAQTSVPILYTAPNGNPLASENLNFVNFCNTYLMVGGQSAAGQVLGSLYITYDIELLKPRPNVVINQPAQLKYQITAGQATATPLGSTQVLTSTSYSYQLQPSQVAFTSTSLTLTGIPVGTLVDLWISIVGNSTTVGNLASSISLTGASANNCFAGNSTQALQAPQNSETSDTMLQIIYSAKATASTVVFTFSGSAAIPASPSSSDLIIFVQNSN